MSSQRHSLKMPSSSTPPVAKSREEELMERNAQLSERNIQLAQEVQKLRQSNSLNVKRVMEYSKRALDATSENNRLKEALRRVSTLIQRFLPVLVQGSNLMQDVVTDLGKISIAENDSAQTNSEPNEGEDEANSGELVPLSPQRTGIARPMVKGHSISKPSISLQRVVPRQTTAPYVPLPIRDLNLADMVRADDRNRLLSEEREGDDPESEDGDDNSSRESEGGSEENEHRSEEDEHGLEEDEHGSEEDEHGSEETEHGSEGNQRSSEDNEHGLEGNEHGSEEHNHNSVGNDIPVENEDISEENEVDSVEIERNSEDNESERDPNDSVVRGVQYRVSDLSVVEEEPSVLEEVTSEHSAGSPVEISANLSPIVEEGASTSSPHASSQPVRQRQSKSIRQSQSVRQSRKKPKRVEVEDENSEEDEEEVELSLIKARCKLMNGDRRRELKEGTSRDYDAKGYFSPNPRRNRKRKKATEEEAPNEEETPNETSALRKSIDGLMSSLKKSRVSRKKQSIGIDSPRRASAFVGEELHPRVSLVRMSSWCNMDGLAAEGESSRSQSPPFRSSLSVLLTPSEMMPPPIMSPRPATPSSTTPPSATSPIMVTKRRRCSYVTTRKRSSRQPVVEEAVVLNEIENQPRRSGLKRSNSWAESIRKRNRIQSEEDSPESPQNESGLNSPQEAAQTNGRTSVSTDELPTVVLSRCSESFIARNSSKGLLDKSLNDSAKDSDTPLSVLAARPPLEGKRCPVDVPSNKVTAKPARSKPRSKPKSQTRSKLSAKSANANDRSRKRTPSESSNGSESDFHNSLNPSFSNISMASSVGDAESLRVSPNRSSASSRPRRAKAPLNLKEAPLNVKMRRQ